MLLFIAVVTALVCGFLAGLLSFRVKTRWCWRCGTTTSPHLPTGPNRGRFRD
jgi:hypothetical protein